MWKELGRVFHNGNVMGARGGGNRKTENKRFKVDCMRLTITTEKARNDRPEWNVKFKHTQEGKGMYCYNNKC